MRSLGAIRSCPGRSRLRTRLESSAGWPDRRRVQILSVASGNGRPEPLIGSSPVSSARELELSRGLASSRNTGYGLRWWSSTGGRQGKGGSALRRTIAFLSLMALTALLMVVVSLPAMSEPDELSPPDGTKAAPNGVSSQAYAHAEGKSPVLFSGFQVPDGYGVKD